MNPNPENKEKARPFRNPGAAEETPSGSGLTEESVNKVSAGSSGDTLGVSDQQADDTYNKGTRDFGKTAIIVAIILVGAVLIVVGFFAVRTLFGNSQAAGAVSTANESIAKLMEANIPTQEDFNRALDDYNAVPYDHKQDVEHAELLEKYKDVDLKTVRDIATRINGLDEYTSFLDIKELEEEYEKLTSQEKQFVDGERLEAFKQLNDVEKVVFKAVDNIRSLLVSSDNFKVVSATVKDDTGRSMSYRMQITYSYVDDKGTLRESTTYLSMMSENDDVEYKNAVNSGNPDSYIRNTGDMEEYTKCESPEVEIDTDKLMYYLETS